MFECRPNCGECCGCIPISKAIYEKHKDKIQVEHELIGGEDTATEEVYPVTKDVMCIFLNRTNRMCMIYEDRPVVCKDYGVTLDPRLQCPYIKPDGAQRNSKERRRFRQFQDDFMNKVLVQLGGKK